MTRAYSRSFLGGELTPEFYGQIADPKFQTGMAKCRNFKVLPHGPVQNRAGLEFVREVKDSARRTRLLPFTYSTTQTMVIEAGHNYLRFHTAGATLLAGSPAAYNGATAYAIGALVSSAGVNYHCVAATTGNAPPNAAYWYALPSAAYEIPSSYAETDLFSLRTVQSADVFTVVHTSYAPAELRRLGALSWTLSAISFEASLSAPTALVVTATLGGTPGTPTRHRYAVTSVSANNTDESPISTEAAPGAAQALISGVTQANPGVITTTADHKLAAGDEVAISGIVGMTGLNLAGLVVASTPTATTLTVSLAGAPVDTSAFGAWVSDGSIFMTAGVKNNLFDTGASNSITWTAAAGALRYNVYKYSNGLWGYLGQASGTSFLDDSITPDIGQTPPEGTSPFVGAGNYPGAVTYFEQRRCFAGSLNAPQTIWMTRSGTESNLTYSIPVKDNDAITFRVVAREANTVRHLVPLSDLLALTSAAEWRIAAVNSDALTPTSVSVKPQSYIGSADAQPVVVNNNVVYAAARGGHAREMAFNWQAGGHVTGDLSLRAPHLFDGLTIVDMAFSKSPYPIIWMVSSNGILLGLTYVPEQQVGAWHWHDTDGLFESVACVAEGADDVLYAVIRRTIGGVQKRYIERMRPRAFATQADCFFVDSGLTYSGAPATVISGLWHLEGKTVSVLADGAVHRQLVVSGGSVTLDVEASKVQVGLPIAADIQTLPLSLEMPGYGQGTKKNVNKVFLKVSESSGVFAGPSFDRLVEAKIRTNEPYGTPPRLQSREIEIVIKGAWDDNGAVCVRQADPLPMTITGLTLDLATGG